MTNNNTFFDKVFNIFLYIIYSLCTLICAFPFYYIFIQTISDNHKAAIGKVLFYPIGMHIGNYIEVFKIPGLGQAAFISLSRTVLGTLLTLISAAFLGYALGKKEFWARTLWYRFIIITMYFNAGIIPWYITMKELHLRDNFLAYILPGAVIPFYVILCKTYIENIPAELEESAQIDGAGYLTRFIHIIIPISKPIIGTIAVFASVDKWNSFTDTLFLMSKSSLFTLQYLLYQYLQQADSLARLIRSDQTIRSVSSIRLLTPLSIRMTISIVVVVPIIVVYPFMQRLFTKGIMVGAIKG